MPSLHAMHDLVLTMPEPTATADQQRQQEQHQGDIGVTATPAAPATESSTGSGTPVSSVSPPLPPVPVPPTTRAMPATRDNGNSSDYRSSPSPQASAPPFPLGIPPPPSLLSGPARPLSQPIAASSQHGNGAQAQRRSIAHPSSPLSHHSLPHHAPPPPLPAAPVSPTSKHHQSTRQAQPRQNQRTSVARTAKRESSLTSPLPVVLPALPALIPVHSKKTSSSPTATKVPTMLALPCSPSSPPSSNLHTHEDDNPPFVLPPPPPPDIGGDSDIAPCPETTYDNENEQHQPPDNGIEQISLPPLTKQSCDKLDLPPLLPLPTGEANRSGSASGSGSNIPNCSESTGKNAIGLSSRTDTLVTEQEIEDNQTSSTSPAVAISLTSCSSSTSTSSSSSSSSSSALTTISAPASLTSACSTFQASHSCPSPQQHEEEPVSSLSSHPSDKGQAHETASHSPTPPPPPPPSQNQLKDQLPLESEHQEKHQQQWKESPQRYLDRLKETVAKAEMGNILSRESDPFHQAVLELYMERFDFRKDPIDLALRKFLLDFHFPKEAQQIDRVLQAFANRYHACNPNLFRSADIVYTLSFSLMLLHTDAHNKNVRFKMTKEQYIMQAKSIEGVNTIATDILEILYDNITFLKFVYAEDDLDVTGQKMAEVQQTTSWFPRRRTASRSDSYNMIRHGSITQLSPDLSDLIPFRWPFYWKGTIELVDNVQINNQFTKAPSAFIPGLRCREASTTTAYDTPQSPQSQSRVYHTPSLAERIDSPIDTIKATSFQNHYPAAEGGNMTVAPPGPSSEVETAELKVAKHGILSRKIDIENGKKSTVRSWRELGVILSGSQLLFFTDLSWFHQQRRACHDGFNPESPPEVDGYFASELSNDPPPPMPQALMSTHDSIAVVDSTYQKYPHVFRLVCPNGKQYLFRADSEREMNDWMSKINYATAFKTSGVRLRNYRVAWAEDVVWIRDEQGRYQLRRRRRKTSTKEDDAQQQLQQQQQQQQLDEGRAELIKDKLKDIDNLIQGCAASLANELRFTRNLEVMIPLQPSTRQKIILSATDAGKRLRHLMLERTKLDCYRTILERDLAVVAAPATDYDSYWGFARYQGADAHAQERGGTATLIGGSQHGTPVGSTMDPQREWMQERVKGLRQVTDSPASTATPDTNAAVSSSSSSPTKTRPPRPKMILNDFSRTVSESVLDENYRRQRAVTVDFPQETAAIQAAIIDCARGGSGLIPTTSTMSSPDPSIRHHLEGHHERHHSAQELSSSAKAGYRNTIMIPRADNINNNSSSTINDPPPDTAPSSPSTPVASVAVSGIGSAPNPIVASPIRSKPEGVGSPALLSPNTVAVTSRSRALSLPQGAQRPSIPAPMAIMNMPRTVSIYSSSSQTANRLKKILEQGLSHFKRRNKKENKGEGGTDSIVNHAVGSTPSVSSTGSSVSNGGGSGPSSYPHQTRVSSSLSMSRTSSSIGSVRDWSSTDHMGPTLGESLLPVRPSIGSSSGDTIGSRSGTPRIQMISRWETDEEDEGQEEIGDEEDEEKEDEGVDHRGDGEGEMENDVKQIVVSPPSPLNTAQFQLNVNLNLGSEIDLLPQSLSPMTDSNKDDAESSSASFSSAPPESLQIVIPSEEEQRQHQSDDQEQGGNDDSVPVSALWMQSATPLPIPSADQDTTSSPPPPMQVEFDISDTVIDGDESS